MQRVGVSRPPGGRRGWTISPHPPGRVSGTPALWYLGVAGVPPPLPYGVWENVPPCVPRRLEPPKLPCNTFTNNIYTVSYTHLRAHETPEHLVCRLLLEKKK